MHHFEGPAVDALRVQIGVHLHLGQCLLHLLLYPPPLVVARLLQVTQQIAVLAAEPNSFLMDQVYHLLAEVLLVHRLHH